MFIYILIYIPFLLCAWFDFDGKTSPKQKNQIMWIWVIVFTLFRGLRWDTGTDWDQFYYVFNHAEWSNFLNFYRDTTSDKTMDVGYMFFNALFNEAALPYTFFLLVSNFWIMWCFKDFAQRHTAYPILTLIMLMNIGVPFPVRQSIALATSLWGYRFAVEKKWAIFFIVAIGAALIHKGSIVGLSLILFSLFADKWRIKWYWFAAAYLSTYVIAEVLGEYIRTLILIVGESNGQLDSYSAAYLNMDSTSVDFGNFNNSLLNGLSYIIFYAILLYLREKNIEQCNKSVKGYEMFFLMYALSAVIDNLINQSDKNGMTEILGRVTSTIDMLPMLFPLIFTIFLPKFGIKKELLFGIFVIYMAYKYWQQIPGSFYHELFIPYKSIFD